MPKLIDLTNQCFGKFIILHRDYETQRIKNSKEPFWKCQCDCGNVFSARGHDIRQGKILSCGCLKKENAAKINAKDLTNQRFGLQTVQYKCDYLIDKHYVWHCKCDCGNEKDIMGKHLLSGDTQSCGCIKSVGESLITKILYELGIAFEYQKTFATCKRTSLPLFFDFYLPEENILIEYNGIQHYQPIEHFGGEKRFITQQLNDNFKKEWCKKNKIKLIEIPYTDFSKLSTIYLNNLIKGENV